MIGGMKAYTFEEIVDRHDGPIGTPDRDAFEAMVEAGLEEERRLAAEKQARKADEAVRKARRAPHLAPAPALPSA